MAPRAERAFGVDASRDMLALARARLAEHGMADRCAVRQADMYRLPLPDAAFDVVALQMVLHYAEDPAAALAEAARVLRPGRAAAWSPTSRRTSARSCWSGTRIAGPASTMPQLAGWLGAAGCAPLPPSRCPGALPVRIWPARRMPGRVSAPAALSF